LFTARKADPDEMLDFLLQDGWCSIDGRDKTGRPALPQAAEDGNKDAIRRLLERGASPLFVFSSSGETLLSAVVEEGDLAAVLLPLHVYIRGALVWLKQE
jgi:ankyrin repeat protein